MVKIGAHVSAAGSLSKSLENAQRIGAEATQIFISPPQSWLKANHTDEEVEKYLLNLKNSGIYPNFIHGAYLINLATQNPLNLEKAISWLTYSLKEAERFKLEGTIFHLGSAGKISFENSLDQVVRSLNQVINEANTPDNEPPYLILENCAGAGNLIGDTIEELAQIVDRTGNKKIKICLDTQHLFASGYDITQKKILDQLLTQFEDQIGFDNLAAVHLNDSKTEMGSKKDRHENIGEGKIGKEAFSYLLNHPMLSDKPFILEVPGFDNTGPDEKNINLIKSLL